MPEKKATGKETSATVRMSEELRSEAKAYAARKRTSLQAVIDEAVADFLSKKKRNG